MYYHFYHLKHDPFADAPDPAFLFLGQSHQTALHTLLHGIQQRRGLLALCGASGLGKTLLLHTVLAGIHEQQHIKPVQISYPKLSVPDLFALLYSELGLPQTTAAPAERLPPLKHALLAAYEQGWNVVLLVDDMQDMPAPTLHSLLQLSALTTAAGVPLVQMVLAGVPELWRTFTLPPLRPFQTRLACRVTLVPLTAKESRAYICHRFARVLAPAEALFMPGALKPLLRAAHGNPRVLNTLCSNVLITGVLRQQKPISPALVQDVIAEYGEQQAGPYGGWRGVTAASVLLGAGLWWGGQTYWVGTPRHTVMEPVQAVPLAISAPVSSAAALSLPDSIESEPGTGASLPHPPAPPVPQPAGPVPAGITPRKTTREKVLSAPAQPPLKAGQGPGKTPAGQSSPGPVAAANLLTIQIQSFPEGARVMIDRQVVGTTPLTMQLVTGLHTVTLEKSGYSRVRDDVRLHKHARKDLYYTLLMESGGS
jgi:general secretion pathway protein A